MKVGDHVKAQEPFFTKKYRNRIKDWAIRDIEEDPVHGTLLWCVEWYRRKLRFTRGVWFKIDQVTLKI